MVAVAEGDIPAEKPKLLARHVAAVAAGNALEFYDFLTFSYFAVYIGHTFFPFATGSNSLLFTLITFGVGFLTRPLGGIVIGNMGDRIGRRPAMVLSFTLMGLGVIGLALTPSYAQIGIAARGKPGAPTTVVLITHETTEEAMRGSLAAIEKDGNVSERPQMIRIEPL